MSDEKFIPPLNERVAVVEAETRELKNVVVEIKDAIVAIRSTLETVVRVEEKTYNLSAANIRLAEDIAIERKERKSLQSNFNNKISNIEKDVSEIKSHTDINTHGRKITERIMIPIIAALLAASLAIGGNYMIRGTSDTSVINTTNP